MKIGKLRESKNLTQQQLAEAVNVSRSTVAMWESGAAFPRTEILPRLAQALGCEISDLFADVSIVDTKE